VYLWDSRIGTILQSKNMRVRRVQWFPDGRHYILMEECGVSVVHTRTGSTIARRDWNWREKDRQIFIMKDLCFNPVDANELVIVGKGDSGNIVGMPMVGVIDVKDFMDVEQNRSNPKREIFQYIFSGGEEIIASPNPKNCNNSVSISPDGLTIATMTDKYESDVDGPMCNTLTKAPVHIHFWCMKKHKLLTGIALFRQKKTPYADGTSVPFDKPYAQHTSSCAFHPTDPDLFLTGHGNAIHLWSISGKSPRDEWVGKKGVYDDNIEQHYAWVARPDRYPALKVKALWSTGNNERANPWAWVKFSYDGTLIAGAGASARKDIGGGEASVISLKTLEPASDLLISRSMIDTFDIRHDNGQLCSADGGRWIYNYGLHLHKLTDSLAEADTVPVIIEGPTAEVSMMGQTPDGTRLIMADKAGDVYCYDLRTYIQVWKTRVLGSANFWIAQGLEFTNDPEPAIIHLTGDSLWIINTNDGSTMYRYQTEQFKQFKTKTKEGRNEQKFRSTFDRRHHNKVAKRSPCGKFIAINCCTDISKIENPEEVAETGSVTIVPYPPPIKWVSVGEKRENTNCMECIHMEIPHEKTPEKVHGWADMAWGNVRNHVAYYAAKDLICVNKLNLENKSFTLVTKIYTKPPHFGMYINWGAGDKTIIAGTGHSQFMSVWDPFKKAEQHSDEDCALALYGSRDKPKKGEKKPEDDALEYHYTPRDTSRCIFHKDSRHLLMSGGKDSCVHIYDMHTRQIVKSWAHTNSVLTATWHDDCTKVFVSLVGSQVVVHSSADLAGQ